MKFSKEVFIKAMCLLSILPACEAHGGRAGTLYNEVDYVSSDGSSLLLTDYKPNPRTWMKASIRFTGGRRDVPEGYTYDFFGVREDGSEYAARTTPKTGGDNSIRAQINSAEDEEVSLLGGLSDGQQTLLFVANDYVASVSLSRAVEVPAVARATTSTLPMALMGVNTGSGAKIYKGCGTFRVSRWRIYESDGGVIDGPNQALVHDFVPVTDPSGVAGLLDLVTGAFLASETGVALSSEGHTKRSYLVDGEGNVTQSGGDFLDGLSLDANMVDASPYAAGGDLILKDGDDYVHVFHDPSNAATFTPSQALMARVLAVGGGGAGGLIGGGGGAGGMVDVPVLAFSAQAYDVIVGAGGAWPQYYRSEYAANRVVRDVKDLSGASVQGYFTIANTKRFSGSDTYVADGQGNDVVRALGGGGGGSSSSSARDGLSGGSGGGAYVSANAGLGASGQGNDGGRNAGNTVSAGGGGAGASAESIARNSTPGGSGGAGRVSDILGFEQHFAGGGGGGTEPSWTGVASGGIGGGGDGATGYGSDNARMGTCGLGGGGGGGGGQSCNVWAYLPGDGGSGIVAIRYADPATLSGAPMVALNSVAANSNATATVSWTVMGSGTNDVTAVWGDSAEHLCYTNFMASMEAGSGNASLYGLLPGRTYYAALKASNAIGDSELSGIVEFTMPAHGDFPAAPRAEQPVIATATVKDRTGGEYVLIDLVLSQPGAGMAYGDCTATVRWGLQNSYALMTNSHSSTVSSDGTVTLRPSGITTERYYAIVEVVNANGFADRLPVEFCALDDSVYYWNPAVAEGDWRDRANWSNDLAAAWGLGYPMNEAIADFTTTLCATVHVSGVVTAAAWRKEVAGGQYTFVGDTDDAAILTLEAYKDSMQGGQRLVFDHIKATLHGSYKIGAGDAMILTNGANIACYRSGGRTTLLPFELTGGNSRLELRGGSELSIGSYETKFKGERVIVAEGSKIRNWSSIAQANDIEVLFLDGLYEGTDYNAASDNSTYRSSTTVLSGATPELRVNRLYAQHTNGTVALVIPAEGWGDRPVIVGKSGSVPLGRLSAGDTASKKIILAVPKTAPIKSSTIRSSSESKIAACQGGISFPNFEFGQTASQMDYFYFKDAAGDSYVYAEDGSGGLAPLANPGAALADPPAISEIWYHHNASMGTCVILR